MTTPSASTGTHQATACAGVRARSPWTATIGSSPTRPASSSASAAQQQAAGGQHDAAAGRCPRRPRPAEVVRQPRPSRPAPTARRPGSRRRRRAGRAPAPARRRPTSAPTTVERGGRSPCRSHSQAITATGAVYSISSATPTCMCGDGVEVGELAAGHGDQRRRRRSGRRCAAAVPASAQRDDARPAAAPGRRRATRTATAAPALQPASIRPRARAPESPNDAADTRANAEAGAGAGRVPARGAVMGQRAHGT